MHEMIYYHAASSIREYAPSCGGGIRGCNIRTTYIIDRTVMDHGLGGAGKSGDLQWTPGIHHDNIIV
jgi:hypothetical protein